MAVRLSYRLVHDPFGMLTPGRNWTAGSEYRYGFNGKEQDSETYGEGNIYDYGFRIYNPRLGKFLSVDPLTSNFPQLTPFQFAANAPTIAIDLDGLEAVVVTIRPVPGSDPNLSQVNIYKTASKIDQPNLTVAYNTFDAAGNLINSTTGTGFVPGSIEAQLATAVNTNGNNGIDRLTAITPISGTPFTTTFKYKENTNQDPESLVEDLTALNGFQYNLNIEYNTGGYRLNETDLAPSNSPVQVQSDLVTAATTLSNNRLPVVGIMGTQNTLDMTRMSIVVVGETDGQRANHTPQTLPNDKPIGNPALAQDRANVIAQVLKNLLPGRDIDTSINTNDGGDNQSNRNSHLNISR